MELFAEIVLTDLWPTLLLAVGIGIVVLAAGVLVSIGMNYFLRGKPKGER
jgi:hypothetical protein